MVKTTHVYDMLLCVEYTPTLVMNRSALLENALVRDTNRFSSGYISSCGVIVHHPPPDHYTPCMYVSILKIMYLYVVTCLPRHR